MGCDWWRDVVSGVDGEKKFFHLVYGLVTYRQAAELDIKGHDCGVYMMALRYYKAKMYLNAMRGEAVDA